MVGRKAKEKRGLAKNRARWIEIFREEYSSKASVKSYLKVKTRERKQRIWREGSVEWREKHNRRFEMIKER